MFIHLEYSKGSSNKFWELSVKGKTMTVHYGRIGTKGQMVNKTCASPEEARR